MLHWIKELIHTYQACTRLYTHKIKCFNMNMMKWWCVIHVLHNNEDDGCDIQAANIKNHGVIMNYHTSIS